MRAGGGERTAVPGSSSVGELDVETCKVGEGVAAVMEAKVLVVVIHAGRLVRADDEESGTLATPGADTGFSSLDVGRGRLLPLDTTVTCLAVSGTPMVPLMLAALDDGITSKYHF